MHIPYLKNKIEKEFLAYLQELEGSIKSCVLHHQGASAESRRVFSLTYPLFVLLTCLSSSEYMRNPARDAALSELVRKGDKKGFVKALTSFNRKGRYHEEVVLGLQRSMFTGYFDELYSDTLIFLNSFYSHNYRGAFIAIRCMLEDLYRHLYYMDHPQEFYNVTNGEEEFGLGITPLKLREYLPRTSYLRPFKSLNLKFLPKADNEEMSVFGLNDALYRKSSAYVHGSSSEAFSKLKTNSDMKIIQDRESVVIETIKDFTRVAIVFLSAAHLDHIFTVNEYEKSIIFSVFSSEERSAFRRVVNI